MAREIVEKRTRRSKTFELDRRRRRVEVHQCDIHHNRAGKLEEINLCSRRERGHHVIDSAPYVLRIADDVPAYRYTSSRGRSVEVTLRFSLATSVEHQDRDHRWIYPSSDVSYLLRPTPRGCLALLILNSERSPRVWEWDIIGDRGLLVPIKGRDAKGRVLELVETWVGDRLRVEWTGRALDKKTLRKHKSAVWSATVDYPITVDPTVNESVTASADDVFSAVYNGTSLIAFGATNTYMALGVTVYGVNLYGGVRFQSVAVPPSANVTASTLKLRNINLNGVPAVRFYGVKVANAGAWSNPGNRVKNITKTTAYNDVSAWTSGADNSIPVTAQVAEIIGQTAWSSGNALALAGFGTVVPATTNKLGHFAAYDHATLSPPRLDITYSIAGGGGGDNVVGTGLTRSILLIPHHLVNN